MDWLEVGRLKNVNGYIHPSGNVSDDAYWASGEYDASIIQCQIDAPSVLEFGCGNGRILKNLYYFELYGVDISSELIAGLENAYLVSEFDKTVDAVFSLSVFIHLKKEDAKAALSWIYDHLNIGGKAYLQIPIYDKDREPELFNDVGVWSEKHFVDFVTSLGFKIEELYTNPGEFSYSNIGVNHNLFQVLSK